MIGRHLSGQEPRQRGIRGEAERAPGSFGECGQKLGGGRLRIRQLQDCLQAGRLCVCAEVLADTLMDAFMPPRHGWVPLLWLLWLLRLLRLQVAGKLRQCSDMLSTL